MLARGSTPDPSPAPADRGWTLTLHDEPSTLDVAAWDTLLAAQAEPTPFLRQAFLAALHESGSAVPETGWSPVFALLRDEAGALAAAAPLYLKTHSWGEFVFDHAWARAWQQHGLRYYPKLVCAVPFSPVPGSRLLARDAQARAMLIDALPQVVEAVKASSIHLLFGAQDEIAALRGRRWAVREQLQFHWTRDEREPVASFDELLARMQRHKRKNIQQEQRRLREAGVDFEVLEGGAAIDEATWDFFHRCYTSTYHAHGHEPYLTRDFFLRLGRDLPEHVLLFVARRAGRRIAASLLIIDRDRGAAWGRHWGAVEPMPLLHFECCYHRPLAWCIEQGFRRFEGGVQGAHKMARGLLPVPTQSAHWVGDRRFATAIEAAVQAEREDVAAWADELRDRSPFR